MTATQVVDNQTVVLQNSLQFMRDEAYTKAKTFLGTLMVGGNPTIDTKTETFVGQLKWNKPLNHNINVLTLTDPTAGVVTNGAQDFLTYIKTARSTGAEAINTAELITQMDSIERISNGFAEAQVQDENGAITSLLKGIAISEALIGTQAGGLGGQTFSNDPQSAVNGFYVDLGAETPVVAASVAVQGAARATNFLNALTAAFKDYEPAFAYLAITPEVFSSLRSANLVDDIGVVDGNITFDTIFQGKFRLFVTRTNMNMSTAELTALNGGGGVNIVGTKTSFIILPGSIESEALVMPVPVEITRNGNAYQGGGISSIWSRWGYVLAPAGYSWGGSQTVFPSDTHFKQVVRGGTPVNLDTLTTNQADTATGVWVRKATSVLTLGILPVFHA
jgi:hypothetical protein